MKPTCIAALLAAAIVAGGLSANPTTVRIAPGENWWGAANYFGTSMPFTADSTQKIDLRKDNYHNQCASFLVSDKGRSIWCARQCLVEIGGGEIRLTPDDGKSPVVVAEGGATLRDASRRPAPFLPCSSSPLRSTTPGSSSPTTRTRKASSNTRDRCSRTAARPASS